MRELLPRLRQRLAVAFLPGLVFGVIAIAAEELEHLPGDLRALAAPAASPLLRDRLHHMGAALALVLIAGLAVLALARTRAELLARPRRLLAVLLGAGTLSVLAMVSGGAAWSAAPGHRIDAVAATWMEAARAWSTMLMWGVMWGWLFLQHLQQREDDRRLALLLGRRSALSRQVLESRLRRARSQVDPAMIAAVLRTVRDKADHGLHEPSPREAVGADATELVDRLANTLRLLLHRVRHQAPTLEGDLALLRALVALQEARQGVAIQLNVDASVQAHAQRPAKATFLAARMLLDAALAHSRGDHEGQGGLALAVAVQGDAATIAMALPLLGDAALSSLVQGLEGLQPGLTVRHHPTPSGRRLVAHVPLH